MSFMIPCPFCGSRSVYEFVYGGEFKKRPALDASRAEWIRYIYLRENLADVQLEWWYHRQGCQTWFLGRRHTVTNQVVETFWPEEMTQETSISSIPITDKERR
jgi:heterotetrameric sarcosine oxidase delta subunit